jgi:hypothetical protein
VFIVYYIINISPSSPIAYLVYLFLFTIFSIALIFIFARKNNEKVIKKEEPKREITIKELLNIVKNPKSSAADLVVAIRLFNENINMENYAKESFEFFDKLLTHKNRNKELFRYFHDVIVPNNTKYKAELEKIERKALNKD